MNRSRRSLIATGLAGAAGLAVAARLADRYGLIPPDHGGLYGPGETLTYASQRLLTARHSLAREFHRSQISQAFPVNGPPPGNDTYQSLLAGKFAAWRLRVDGLVARPLRLSLAELRAYPETSQITLHQCEEGWSAIAEWTGVQLSQVLRAAGVSEGARYVVFFPWDDDAFGVESLDMADALHPQTLLAYGMNGAELPTAHGAPLRLRVARQVGYKSVKYLSRVWVTESLAGVEKELGYPPPDFGYSWWAGI